MMNDQFDETKLNTDYPFTYLHILGGCHGIAFMGKIEIKNWYEFEGALMADDFITENGEHPVTGSQIVCSHCGKPMEFPPQLLDQKLLKIIRKRRAKERSSPVVGDTAVAHTGSASSIRTKRLGTPDGAGL